MNNTTQAHNLIRPLQGTKYAPWFRHSLPRRPRGDALSGTTAVKVVHVGAIRGVDDYRLGRDVDYFLEPSAGFDPPRLAKENVTVDNAAGLPPWQG